VLCSLSGERLFEYRPKIAADGSTVVQLAEVLAAFRASHPQFVRRRLHCCASATTLDAAITVDRMNITIVNESVRVYAIDGSSLEHCSFVDVQARDLDMRALLDSAHAAFEAAARKLLKVHSKFEWWIGTADGKRRPVDDAKRVALFDVGHVAALFVTPSVASLQYTDAELKEQVACRQRTQQWHLARGSAVVTASSMLAAFNPQLHAAGLRQSAGYGSLFNANCAHGVVMEPLVLRCFLHVLDSERIATIRGVYVPGRSSFVSLICCLPRCLKLCDILYAGFVRDTKDHRVGGSPDALIELDATPSSAVSGSLLALHKRSFDVSETVAAAGPGV
jgi:hypothetical protein